MILSLPPLILSLLFILLGVTVYNKNRSNSINRSFFLLSMTTFFWQFSWTILFQISNPVIANILIKVGYFFITFLPAAFYSFLANISEAKKEDRWIKLSYLTASIFAVFLIFSNLYINGYYNYFFGYYPKAGIIHPVFLTYMTAVAFRGLYLVYKTKKSKSHNERMQLNYTLMSLIIYFFASVDFLDNYGLEAYPLGVLFVFTSLSLITYSILKHKLMDIEILIKRGTYFLLFLFFILSPFALLTNIIIKTFHHIIPGYELILSTIMWSLFVLVSDKIKGKLVLGTDKIFFKADYNYEQVLDKLSSQIHTISDIYTLVDRFGLLIMSTLKVRNVGFFILNKSKTKFIYVTRENMHDVLGKKITKQNIKKIKYIKINDTVINLLKYSPNNTLVYEQLKAKQNKGEKRIKNIIKFMDSVKSKLLVASCVDDHVTGIISLGGKKSDDMFKSKDIKFTSYLSSQGALVVSKIFEIEDKAMMRAEKELDENHKRELENKNRELSAALNKLKFAQERLIEEEQMSAMGKLAGEVAHDIRNPLSSINRLITVITHDNNLENIESILVDIYKKVESLDHPEKEELFKELKFLLASNIEIKNTFKEITEINTTLRTIANDFLEYSKVSNEIATDPINISNLVKDIVSIFRMECSENNIELIETIEPDINVVMFEHQIQRIFGNIIDNAIKAVQESKNKDKKIYISLTDNERDNMVVITIKDTGCGISKDNLKNIFKPFYTNRKNLQGTGLGLASVKKVLDNLHGKISVESELNKGSIFSISIPKA